MASVGIKTWGAAVCCALLVSACRGAEGEATLEQRLLAEPAASLAAAALAEGDAVRGALVFHHSAVTCVACHSVGDRPSGIGPDLTKYERQTSDAALVESLLEPSKVIAPAYATLAVETADGLILRGVVVEDTARKLVLRDAAQPQKLIEINPQEIVARQPTKQSIMPTGQVNLLADRKQFLDLTRYLMALRDGGPKRAREIERSLAAMVREFPDQPLPNRPVVQRGEVDLRGDKKYPRGIALGFTGGTVLFDADQLAIVACWQDGFMKSSPQNYFGVNMHNAGGAPQLFAADPHPLGFKLANQEAWQAFEAPLKSDPNSGTRFDGYQVGRDFVRLHYHLRAGETRLRVTEDIRAQQSPQGAGFVRLLRFADVPVGAQIAWSVPRGKDYYQANKEGQRVAFTPEVNNAPWLGYQAGGEQWALQAHTAAGAQWSTAGQADQAKWQLVSAPASQAKAIELRLELWHARDAKTANGPIALGELPKSPPMTDTFDLAIQPASPPPLLNEDEAPQVAAAPARPSVNPKENIDEFPSAKGRFLRFVVTGTTDRAEPGLDELEVYGVDPKVNLALQGKASASSVIPGYAIHQIKHLNDGKLGNNQSWISAEAGGGWAQIEFPDVVEMRKIVWARDRTGTCRDRLVNKYRIEVSNDGKEWVKVGDESGRAPTAAAGPGTVIRNASPGYVMESIPLPFAGCRPSDVVFAADGTMFALEMTQGQVWRARIPPVGHPQRVRWQRYAAGLYHPIGLAIVGERLFVAQKPEVTELIDHDGDGTVDHYRTLATGWGLSTGWHEYCFGLAVDREQNLWFALNTGYFWTNPGYVNPGRWRGSVMRISTATGRLEEVAKGCRVPNGISTGPEGDLYFTDNQGDWIQACKLAHVVKGRFYGHPEYKEDALPSGQYPDGRSAIWFPYQRMRSISGPIHDTTQGKFGPFAEQMFVGDVGYGANAGIMRVALEKIEGEYQGACFPFVDNQPLGCERMRFGPDNSLYMASLTSGLTRLTYVGERATLAMQSLRIRPGGKGFVVKFTKPVAADQKIDAAQIAVKRYHLLYTGNYGSPQADEQTIPVQAAELSADRTELTLTFPVESYPIGMVYEIRLGELRDEQGEKMLHREAWYTVHRIPQ